MTCEEIRRKHAEGVSIHTLADLNACHNLVISRIVNGEDYVWTKRNRPLGDRPYKYYVVNSTEGIIYDSLRAAERGSGVYHNVLRYHFKKEGNEIIYKGMKFRLYRIPTDS